MVRARWKEYFNTMGLKSDSDNRKIAYQKRKTKNATHRPSIDITKGQAKNRQKQNTENKNLLLFVL